MNLRALMAVVKNDSAKILSASQHSVEEHGQKKVVEMEKT